MDTQVARERLLELRRELQETIEGVTSRMEAGVTADLPTGGHDFGDEGAHEQQAAEQDAFVEAARTRLAGVEDALRRIEDGTYGLSVVSGKPIPEERLEARPDALTLADEEL
ncbi:TraR/DksA family transcriptional regulator [Kineococcus arenarius]|uniref:TraR/DksA family transcriptional regulator n=1 Tax=Kineococcus sp. SYSU DK007 TaxID=3383128 RepID=UPI003D7EE893